MLFLFLKLFSTHDYLAHAILFTAKRAPEDIHLNGEEE